MARIKRGAKGVRRIAKASNRAKQAQRARAQTSSILDRAMGLLPFTEQQWHMIFLWLIIGGALALAWFVASLAGLPAVAQAQVSQFASRAGFEVRHVRVSGIKRMNEQSVYERVLGAREMPMPQVDVYALRGALLKLAWVKDARVSRQLPDVLAIDIVEREPHAVLQKADRLMLIDTEGVELEPVQKGKVGKRLVVTGLGAGKQIAALDRLMAAAPALADKIAKARWVGNRRWNLTFRTGQVLALPEGEEESASSLIKFARLDGQSRLLGGKISSFDMRAPPRIYMRVPGRADALLKSQEAR